MLKAADAKTGKVVWEYQTGSGVVAPPATWMRNGEQYVSVVSGWGGAVPLWGGDVAKKMSLLEQGGMVWVFKIPKAGGAMVAGVDAPDTTAKAAKSAVVARSRTPTDRRRPEAARGAVEAPDVVFCPDRPLCDPLGKEETHGTHFTPPLCLPSGRR